MRKCLRCETVMVEGLMLMDSSDSHNIDVREKGIFKWPLAKIMCAVCPQCGYVETYIEDTERIKALADNDR